MLIHYILLFLLFFSDLATAQSPNFSICPKNLVLVTGYAKVFVGEHRIPNAMIHILGTDLYTRTNQEGRFSFCVKPGKIITLQLSKISHSPFENYKTTQIGSFFVPKEGFHGEHHELTFQVPRQMTYILFSKIVTTKQHILLLPQTCQVATTITAFGKTLQDDPQGEAGAKIIVSHHGKVLNHINAYYPGIFLKKTNPFVLDTNHSSLDGGVLILNLPASKTLYKITAKKDGKRFTSEYFFCQPGAFINLSPPHGVSVK